MISDHVKNAWEEFKPNAPTDCGSAAMLFAERMLEAEREAAAKAADDMADDLASRMKEPDWKENITGEQVINGYRMIGKLIRALATSRARRAARNLKSNR